MARQPILNLDIFEPRFVAIGPPGAKVEYELAHPGSLSLVAMRRRERLVERYQALLQAAEQPSAAEANLTEEQQEERARELSGLLFELVRMCLKAPDDVIRRLGDVHLAAILAVFTEPQQAVAQTAGAAETAPVNPRPGPEPNQNLSTGASGSLA